MKLLKRIVNAVRGEVQRPRVGQVIVPRAEDSVRDYPSAGLTPSRLAAVLREADDGSLSTAMQLFEEMEEKDAHLYSVANTRRLALTGLEWQVLAPDQVNSSTPRRDNAHIDIANLKDEVAGYCRAVLGRLDRFDEALQHLSLAIGRNISIVEIVWDEVGGELVPVDLVPVDFTRIVFDELDRPRVLTAEEPRNGIELTPNKFIVHTPHSVSGHVQRGGLLRVTAMVYLAKNLALKDWMIFAEIFGMPVRLARYEPTATADEKRELLHMLESLGSNAAGIFSRAVELQIVETKRNSQNSPYQSLVEFLNREMSKAWVGQTLTTDISGQRGTLAASQVHEQVRHDLLADDMRKEARTLRRDLLAPLVRLKFGPEVPVPHFRRKVRQASNAVELADVLDKAVNRLGLHVSQDWALDSLGIPPHDGTASLTGANNQLSR